MKKILIFPHNGNGLEALGCLAKNFKLAGFVHDEPEKQGKHANGYTIYSRQGLKIHADAKVLAVPGSPWSYLEREKAITGLGLPKSRFATVIHPSAVVSPLAKIGVNVILMAGVVITSNAVIGDHVVILPNTVIHHDVEVGPYTMIASNVTVAGYAQIGKNCYIGGGATLSNRVKIGDRALVGMAANVIVDVPADAKVVGNPAKRIP